LERCEAMPVVVALLAVPTLNQHGETDTQTCASHLAPLAGDIVEQCITEEALLRLYVASLGQIDAAVSLRLTCRV